jgi:hypothetical protein
VAHRRLETLQSPVILKESKEFKPMTRQFHNMSVEDREMFAYNKRHNDLQNHLSQPENRIRYCYEFMKDEDFQMRNLAFEKSLHYISIVEDQTAHF